MLLYTIVGLDAQIQLKTAAFEFIFTRIFYGNFLTFLVRILEMSSGNDTVLKRPCTYKTIKLFEKVLKQHSSNKEIKQKLEKSVFLNTLYYCSLPILRSIYESTV